MEIKKYNSPELARPIGNYSQGAVVSSGKLVFVAGQVALDASGNLVGKGDMAVQVRQALSNLKIALEAGGAKLETVVKTTTYVTSIDDYHRGGAEIKKEFFPADPPPGTLVEVKRLSHPDFLVEIEAVALARVE